jgi:hypothetical protein
MSMLRSYHVSNYGWTPLSQNSCWNAAICCSSRLYTSTNRQAFGFVQNHKIVTALVTGKTGSRWCWKTSSNIGRDKSFVYDLNTRPSIVRVRVGFVSRSAEIQLVSFDLCCHSLLLLLITCCLGATCRGVDAPGELRSWVGLIKTLYSLYRGIISSH